MGVLFLSFFARRVMADLVIHWMQRVLQDVAVHPLEAWDEEEAARPLPIPMQQARREAGGVCVCAWGAAPAAHTHAAGTRGLWVWEERGGRRGPGAMQQARMGPRGSG